MSSVDPSDRAIPAEKAGVPASDRVMRLRTFLILIALIQALDIPAKLGVLVMNDPEVPGPDWGGWAVTAELALSPLATLAVLYFTIRGYLTFAVVALAITALLGWVSMLPSVVNHWAGIPEPDLTGLYTVWQAFVLPVVACVAILLAWQRERIVIAAMLAALPTILGVLGFVGFAIGVMIYGF